jgi:hypothetical protein
MVQHDRIIICFNDFPWYLLTIPQQKDYVLLILESQKSPQIEMMFMGVVNVETFVTVRILSVAYHPNSQISLYLRSAIQFTHTLR